MVFLNNWWNNSVNICILFHINRYVTYKNHLLLKVISSIRFTNQNYLATSLSTLRSVIVSNPISESIVWLYLNFAISSYFFFCSFWVFCSASIFLSSFSNSLMLVWTISSYFSISASSFLSLLFSFFFYFWFRKFSWASSYSEPG